MAEAFPEEPVTSEQYEEDSSMTISVLLLASRWQFDTYGLSTINKSLVTNLRLVDPEDKAIKITCAVVDEGRISHVEVNDAGKYGVVLKGAKKPMSKKRHTNPDLQWLDEYTATYYHHLLEHHYDFIIGHAPYLANGCFNLKDLYTRREVPPKIILMLHGLPKKEKGDVDDEMLEEWLHAADIVFSVGKAVESELLPFIENIDEENRPIHRIYIPSYPIELFRVAQEPKGRELERTQNITMMSAEFKDLDVTGLDFPLAVNATIGAAEHIRDFDGVRTNLTMLAAHEDDKMQWKSASVKILQRKKQYSGLSFKTEVPADVIKLQSYLNRSSLFLLPLKPDSPLFGTEALSAIAAGVPVLVSRYSGIASLLRKMADDEPIVYGTKLESQLDTWKERILEKLLRPDEAQRAANILRERLLLDTSIAQTHLDFINIIAKEACVQLQIDIESEPDSIIPQEHMEAAIKFGVEEIDETDVKKYIVAFLRKILLQREKLDKELLVNYLNPTIAKLLPEVFSILEDKNRKLINIQSGSLIFTLYCPTKVSRLQLQDEDWQTEVRKKMTELCKLLGVEFPVTLQMQEFAEILHTADSRHLMPRRKRNIAESDTRSLGYETMTDLDPEELKSGFKVEGWLSEQQGPNTAPHGGQDQSIQLVKTWTLNHVQPEPRTVKLSNRFTVSDSGVIGISCDESPSLSVMYPDTGKAPVIVSNRKVFNSATFIKIQGKEYLAAASDENGCLYLWDIQSHKSQKVFDPKLPKDKPYKYMNICTMDESTIGYGEGYASFDERTKRVFILKTATAKDWTLSTTLKLLTTDAVYDMCHTKISDGTPFLLFCIPDDSQIMAVETYDGRTQWRMGKQQMGNEFRPWSICADQNGCAYVADFGQNMIHLLSVTDGTATRYFNISGNYGIRNIFGVRFHDQHLFVEHKIRKQNVKKYAITKFQQNKES